MVVGIEGVLLLGILKVEMKSEGLTWSPVASSTWLFTLLSTDRVIFVTRRSVRLHSLLSAVGGGQIDLFRQDLPHGRVAELGTVMGTDFPIPSVV